MSLLFDGSPSAAVLVALVVALALALAFEFVNGFHDTANAVATVIYTHSLTYSGGKGRTLTEWLDDVELLQGDLDRASAVVAEKIVEEVFLLVPFPSERKR